MISRRFNKKIGLLPYISEPLHGFYSYSPQRMGWEISKFNIPLHWRDSQGEGVVCAVLDTGCDLEHDDLKDNLLPGKNFIEVDKSPIDDNGHGTHVSSTIAAINNNTGMVGVAPKAKIVPVKVLGSDGNGSMRSIIDGVRWCAKQPHIDFITMSLGTHENNNKLSEAINFAVQNHKIIFCAAGNSGPSIDIMYPARYSNTIAIGAIDQNLQRTDFSCSGSSLNFLAPGHDILGCIPNNKYALMSGTSMSNPFAVGLACLLLSYNRKYNKFKLKTYQDYINIFCKFTTDLQDARYNNSTEYQGCGIMRPVSFLLDF